MGDSCPQPDTKNRYEGRGSGDRIARLKAIATRQGPTPTKQNSESWLLTKQQGCCISCINTPCTSNVSIEMQGTNIQPPSMLYAINGTNIGSQIRFQIALLAGMCTTGSRCEYSLVFEDITALPAGFTSEPATTCGEYLYLYTSSVGFTQTTIQDIVVGAFRDDTLCGNGDVVDKTVTLILQYP